MLAIWYPIAGTVQVGSRDYPALTWEKAKRVAKRKGACTIRDLMMRWREDL